MGDVARIAALRALDEVVRRGAWPSEACARFMSHLNAVDRSFAHKLLMGTLEQFFTIDHTIKTYTQGRGINGLVRNILRLGCYQIIYLDRVPDRAACWSSVELARDVGKGALSGFINGVLRHVTRDGIAPSPDIIADPVGNMSVETSQPIWLVKLWLDELGDDAVNLLGYRAEPSIDIRANTYKDITIDELIHILDSEKIEFDSGIWDKDCLRVYDSAKILKSDLFIQGQITVQGEMSQWLAKLACEFSPKTIWDMCAAPGGKTAALAAICPDAKIYATDFHKHRVDLIEETMVRLGICNITYGVHDATMPYHSHKFDLVLLDAPCSGLGTLAANPDIRINKGIENIAGLVSIQEELIINAGRHVNDGGIMIYSTCTISKRENEEVIEYFLLNNPEFSILPPTDVPDYYTGNRDMIQTMPHKDSVDGFFVTRFRRKA